VNVDLESSIVGLAIQWVGIVLVTVLLFLLTRSLRRPFLDYWAVAWCSLAFSLSALLVAFCTPSGARVGYGLYFYGEYAFGLFFVTGCRNFARGVKFTRRQALMLVPAAAFAVVLPQADDDFGALMVPHGAILAGIWAAGWWALRAAPRHPGTGAGLRVASFALILLALDFLHYVPTCAYAVWTGHPRPFPHLKYSSLYDLILEMLLGFGLVLMVMESVRRELEEANRKLAAAGERLQVLAERDPLTEALNRHAFHALLREANAAAGRPVVGTVALLDVDDFKSINDTLGHAAGDAALRAVSRALRSVIRADDLLFRWGGDEFLVVLGGLAEEDARARLDRLNLLLAATRLVAEAAPVALRISYGLASVTASTELGIAIEQADREMYLHKQARKADLSGAFAC
jgi:diguanylate cyclase (GGDEF)-like protein